MKIGVGRGWVRGSPHSGVRSCRGPGPGLLIQSGYPGHAHNAHSQGTFNIALLERGLSHSTGSCNRQKGEMAPEQTPEMTGAEGQYSWTT